MESEEDIPMISFIGIKQGGGYRSWKRRYFRNSQNNPFSLDYYENEVGEKYKGSINLRDVVGIDCKERQMKGNMGYLFYLTTDKRIWKIFVENTSQPLVFYQNLYKTVNSARKMNGLPLLLVCRTMEIALSTYVQHDSVVFVYN